MSSQLIALLAFVFVALTFVLYILIGWFADYIKKKSKNT